MAKLLRQAILSLLVLTVLTGLVYPLAVTGIAGLCCSRAANGSLIRHGDRLVGSELIGQPFDGAQYFWPAIGHLAAALRWPQLGRFESGSDKPRPIRRRSSANRTAARRRSGQHTADSRGPGHRFGQRPGSGDQSRGRGVPIAASRPCARTCAQARRAADPAPYTHAPVGNTWRTRRQRADAESRPRRHLRR